MRLPTNTDVTLKYGATTPPYSESAPHAGTDYGYSYFRPYVFAPEDITVTFVGELGACGKAINAKGKDGRTYRFCHLNNAAVQTGVTYKEGTRIARMGDTGFTFGKHLHLVMWVNGNRVDPDKTLKQLIKEESEMLTTNMQNHIYLYNLGRLPDEGARSWVGKSGHTFDKEVERVRKSKEYSQHLKDIRAAKIQGHIPGI